MEERIIVNLPSGGECYSTKTKSVTITPMNVEDENIILSPNLRKKGKVIDTLLKSKVIDCPIAIEDMCKWDRDAILIELYRCSYGDIYKTKEGTDIVMKGNAFEPMNMYCEEDGFLIYINGHDILSYKLPSYEDERQMVKNINIDNSLLDMFHTFLCRLIKKVGNNMSAEEIRGYVSNMSAAETVKMIDFIYSLPEENKFHLICGEDFFDNCLNMKY